MSSTSAPPLSEPRVVSLDALDELIAEIAKLEQSVVQELLDRREYLSRELLSVEVELAEHIEEPKPAKKKKTPAKAPVAGARKITLPALIEELKAAPNHTLNLRKANLDMRSTKVLAKNNPHLLQVDGKGAATAVTLLTASDEEPSRPAAQSPPEDLFSFGDSSPGPKSINDPQPRGRRKR